MPRAKKEISEDSAGCRCLRCGKELTEGNARPYTLNHTRLSAYCFPCEEKQFMQLCSVMGMHQALYVSCARFDVPCEPLALDGSDYFNDEYEHKKSRWKQYILILHEKGLLFKKNGNTATFEDGVTDFRSIFGRKCQVEDFVKYCDYEKAKIQKMPGTAEQREKWGTSDGYTTEEYGRLDRMYENRTSAYRGQDLNDQQEYVIEEACKWQLIAERMRQCNQVKGATDALKAADTLLAAECLRKKDEKPVEQLRMDALVVALEDAGMMEDGKLVPYDKLIEIMRDTFVKSKKYDYSLDACDQMIYDYYNNIRMNADMQALASMPDDMRVEDEYGEFEPEETEEEKKRRKYAGLTKVSFDTPEEE